MAALRAVRPQLVEYGNTRVAPRRPCVIGTDGLDGRLKIRKLDPSLRDVCVRTQQRRALDDTFYHLEHPTTRLLEIVGADRSFGITASEQQGHGQGMNGREGGLSRLLWTGINLLRIEQAAVVAQLKCMGEKAALCIEQNKRFPGLGIAERFIDE
jgi:hypothetical protein